MWAVKSVENAPWGTLWLHFQLVSVLFQFELQQLISAVVCMYKYLCFVTHVYSKFVSDVCH
jgi:hypothetical protein